MTPPAPQERGTVAEAVAPPDPADAARAEHPDSFDPGPETGYLRRGPRDHELPLEIGSAPFDPGPQRYDGGRARRADRRRRKAERKRLERERRELHKREKERARAEERERVERLEADQDRQRELAAGQLELEAREQRESSQQAERARVESESRERAALQERRREQTHRDELKNAERARVERDRLKRKEAEHSGARVAARTPRPQRGPKRIGRPPPSAPEPAVAGPADGEPREPDPSLRRPTATFALALLAVLAIAAGAGSLLGLPVPFLDGEAATQGAPPPLAVIDAGTPTGLTEGPYHPVVGEVGYGEAAARFGAPRGGRTHEGQDVFARPGTPLVAVRDGVVVDGRGGRSFYSGGGGNTLVIYSPLDDRSYVYLHMLKPAVVAKGERVRAGQLVGRLGCSGSCDGPHLHFEIRRGRAVFGPQKKPLNPLPLLRRWSQVPTS